MTPFLKYEDLGVMRHILLVPPTPIDGGVSSPNTQSTALPPATAPAEPIEPPVSVPPRSAQLDSDRAAVEFLCNTTGTSFFYAEEVDLTARVRRITTHSCPNHFSLCQSHECGGSVATRALVTRQVVSIPLYPALNMAPLDTTCNNLLLGVALNGVGIYGSSDGKTNKCVTTLGYTAAGKPFNNL